MDDSNYKVILLKLCSYDQCVCSLEVGKYEFESPGLGKVDLYSADTLVPDSYYAKITKILNVVNYGQVSCDVDVDIVFTFGTQEVRVTPDQYVDRYEQNSTGICHLRIQATGDDWPFYLPVTVLRDNCILYDYEQKAVGFAGRIKN
jgi:hypothetical protein